MILEDEPLTARRLAQLIHEADSRNRVLATLGSVQEAEVYLTGDAMRPHLIFMDIELADGSVFRLFDRTPVTIPVVYCTAYAEHALEAFQRQGIAYVLKPFSAEEIANVFARLDLIREVAESKPESVIPVTVAKGSLIQSLLVRTVDSIYPLAIDQILGAILNDELTTIYTSGHQGYPCDKTLNGLEAILPPERFFRLNRQVIARRDTVRRIEPTFDRKALVTLSFGPTDMPTVSRQRLPELLRWLERA